MNMISISTAPAAGFGDKKYYDLLGTVEVMRNILEESVVDGFELQLEPEWDRENAPLTDSDWADWTKTPKYSAQDIVEIWRKAHLPVLSVHGSRDVGSYLCSDLKRDWEKGKRIIREALWIAQELGARVCVFHSWDTWKKSFDLRRVEAVFHSVVDKFPRVKASVENIPTHLEGHSPFRLASSFDSVTLDLRWASMYNEFDRFESLINKIANIHLRGSLKNAKWIMERSSLDFYEILNKIRSGWRYDGLLTVEPEGKIEAVLFDDFIDAMRSLKP